jgi:hypothetical protein
MAHGWVTPAQLDDALKTAQKLTDLGFREKIGAVLVKKGYLAAAQVKEILLVQGKRDRNRIKGYEILSKLGQGGMGAVFKARQLSLDREVALKVLSPSLAKDRSYVARFLREASPVGTTTSPWSSWTGPRSRRSSVRRDPSRRSARSRSSARSPRPSRTRTSTSSSIATSSPTTS